MNIYWSFYELDVDSTKYKVTKYIAKAIAIINYICSNNPIVHKNYIHETYFLE